MDVRNMGTARQKLSSNLKNHSPLLSIVIHYSRIHHSPLLSIVIHYSRIHHSPLLSIVIHYSRIHHSPLLSIVIHYSRIHHSPFLSMIHHYSRIIHHSPSFTIYLFWGCVKHGQLRSRWPMTSHDDAVAWHHFLSAVHGECLVSTLYPPKTSFILGL